MLRNSPARVGVALILAVLVTIHVPTGAAHAAMTGNLVVNGDAETLDLTGWSDPSGNGYNIDTSVQFAGSACFWGGVVGPVGGWNQEIVQDVSVAAYAPIIDAGLTTAHFRAWGRRNEAGGAADVAGILVEYRSPTIILESFGVNPVNPTNAWVQVLDDRLLPVGTRVARIRLLAGRSIGISSDGGQDNISLVLESPVLDVPSGPPATRVLRLISANPARGTTPTRIAFSMASPGRVRVSVLDLSGRLVRVLTDGHHEAGERMLAWDGRGTDDAPVAAGVYFVRFAAQGRTEHARLVRLD
jgi:FlgD Ig-like domain